MGKYSVINMESKYEVVHVIIMAEEVVLLGFWASPFAVGESCSGREGNRLCVPRTEFVQ
jgi:hypothetical protein